MTSMCILHYKIDGCGRYIQRVNARVLGDNYVLARIIAIVEHFKVTSFAGSVGRLGNLPFCLNRHENS
jgi:hypothetical protein